MSVQISSRWAVSARLAALAIALPLLVLMVVAAHGMWFVASDQLARDRAIGAATGQLTLTPAGLPPREGPGSHPAVDRRHSPPLPGRLGGRRSTR